MPQTNLDRLPMFRRNSIRSSVNVDRDTLEFHAAMFTNYWWCINTANQKVREYRQHIRFIHFPQLLTKPGDTPHFIVAGNPSVSDLFASTLKHGEGVFMTSCCDKCRRQTKQHGNGHEVHDRRLACLYQPNHTTVPCSFYPHPVSFSLLFIFVEMKLFCEH